MPNLLLFLLALTVVSLLASTTVDAFAVVVTTSHPTTTGSRGIVPSRLGASSSTDEETEVERLLRKARELREQASQQEREIHSQLSTKKTQQQSHLDGLIGHYLESSQSINEAVEKFHQKQVSMETLEKLVDRLDDRHAVASGSEVVDEDFSRKSRPRDEPEMRRLDGLIDLLLDAVQVLDDEFKQQHSRKVTGGVAGESTGSLQYISGTESTHFGGGRASQDLRQRLREKRRSREEQFLKRQEEFYEAQRVKKDRPPPPKVGDDHGFISKK